MQTSLDRDSPGGRCSRTAHEVGGGDGARHGFSDRSNFSSRRLSRLNPFEQRFPELWTRLRGFTGQRGHANVADSPVARTPAFSPGKDIEDEFASAVNSALGIPGPVDGGVARGGGHIRAGVPHQPQTRLGYRAHVVMSGMRTEIAIIVVVAVLHMCEAPTCGYGHRDIRNRNAAARQRDGSERQLRPKLVRRPNRRWLLRARRIRPQPNRQPPR